MKEVGGLLTLARREKWLLKVMEFQGLHKLLVHNAIWFYQLLDKSCTGGFERKYVMKKGKCIIYFITYFILFGNCGHFSLMCPYFQMKIKYIGLLYQYFTYNGILSLFVYFVIFIGMRKKKNDTCKVNLKKKNLTCFEAAMSETFFMNFLIYSYRTLCPHNTYNPC